MFDKYTGTCIRPLAGSLAKEARLNRTFSPVEVEQIFRSAKDIKPNELDEITLNLMKVKLLSIEDRNFTCSLG